MSGIWTQRRVTILTATAAVGFIVACAETEHFTGFEIPSLPPSLSNTTTLTKVFGLRLDDTFEFLIPPQQSDHAPLGPVIESDQITFYCPNPDI